jgi:hypothetical protein
MKLKRRTFLFLGGVAIGGIATGAARAFWLSRNSSVAIHSIKLPESLAPNPVAQNSVAQNLEAQNLGTQGVVKGRSLNPAPQGLYAPKRGDVRIAVISDLNSQYGSTTYEREVLLAVKYLPDWQPDIVICSGDMVAGQYPSLTEPEIRALIAILGSQFVNSKYPTVLLWAIMMLPAPCR